MALTQEEKNDIIDIIKDRNFTDTCAVIAFFHVVMDTPELFMDMRRAFESEEDGELTKSELYDATSLMQDYAYQKFGEQKVDKEVDRIVKYFKSQNKEVQQQEIVKNTSKNRKVLRLIAKAGIGSPTKTILVIAGIIGIVSLGVWLFRGSK